MTVALLTLEVGMRVVFGFQVGTSALLYGTRWHRREIEAGHERFDAKHSVRKHENQQSGYSKYFPHQKRRDFEKGGEPFDVTINAHGFRGHDWAVAKEPGVLRVVTLGASSTFGYHNRDEDTYPAQLEALLASSCPGRRVEVINLGIPHLTAAQILALFLAEGLALEPDVVTFYEGINDATRVRKQRTAIATAKNQLGQVDVLGDVYRALKGASIAVAFVDEKLVRRNRSLTRQDLEINVEAKLQAFVPNLDRLREACVERGIHLIVASQQVQSLSASREELRELTYAQEQERVRRKLDEQGSVGAIEVSFLTHRELMDDLERWAQRTGVEYVDGIEALDGHRDRLVSWVHLDRDGNLRLAEALGEAILRLACTTTER